MCYFKLVTKGKTTLKTPLFIELPSNLQCSSEPYKVARDYVGGLFEFGCELFDGSGNQAQHSR